MRETCTADHLPRPRAVGMPRALRPAAMARKLVAPAACNVLIVGQYFCRPGVSSLTDGPGALLLHVGRRRGPAIAALYNEPMEIAVRSESNR